MTRGIIVESKTQFIKYEAENRAAELAIINKRKPKHKGHYCFITKYVKDFIPVSTQILIKKGVNEEKRVRHFVEKRQNFHPTFND